MRELLVVVLALTGCAADPPGESIVFDPCDRPTVALPEGTADQVASLDEALARWRDAGVDGPARDDAAPAPSVTVVFRDGAAANFGFYDAATATVYINTRLDPQQRAIVIAHELGHALGLFHVEAATRASVMNPGNTATPPNASDAAALAALWGACPAPDP
ncbi:MAG: ImmA/IrrE family metallo-endopeptidase [Deltaproteobacteria bacterium]|nr:ImmA/IrrE family metallo-endopeptidase [Deltaproteobacteria bacterium]